MVLTLFVSTSTIVIALSSPPYTSSVGDRNLPVGTSSSYIIKLVELNLRWEWQRLSEAALNCRIGVRGGVLEGVLEGHRTAPILRIKINENQLTSDNAFCVGVSPDGLARVRLIHQYLPPRQDSVRGPVRVPDNTDQHELLKQSNSLILNMTFSSIYNFLGSWVFLKKRERLTSVLKSQWECFSSIEKNGAIAIFGFFQKCIPYFWIVLAPSD